MAKYYYQGVTFTSQLELTLYSQIYVAELPLPVVQYKPFETDKRAFDFAWPDRGLLVEVQGGIWAKGAHTRGSGYLRDIIKHNDAVLAGWKVLWFATNHVNRGVALETLRKVLT